MDNKFIFVFGTLRKNNALNYVLKNCSYVVTTTLNGYKMYTNGLFPYIIPTTDKNKTVVGEIWKLPNGKKGIKKLKELDFIETGYKRKNIIITHDKIKYFVGIYIYENKEYVIKKYPEVISGDFNISIEELRTLKSFRRSYNISPMRFF